MRSVVNDLAVTPPSTLSQRSNDTFITGKVRASLVDTVPKAVMHFLVNAVQRGLQQHLIRMLYRDDLFGELLREQPELAQHRLHLSERLSALNEAVHALSDVPEELRRSN